MTAGRTLGGDATKIHANAKTCPHCRALIVSRVLEDHIAPVQVAAEFRTTVTTVHKWLRRFRREGMDGLTDRTSAPKCVPKRMMQPGAELREAVMKVLHVPPAEFGLNRTTWRMKDLHHVLARNGTQATLNSIRTVVRAAGIRWKNARIALTSKDPDYRAKLDAIKYVLARLQKDEAFFSIDELGPVAVKMRGGRALQLPGEVRTVPQWQKSRGTLVMTAALELASNQMTYFFSERKNTEETIRLIDLLRKEYCQFKRLYLSWDAAPWHRSEGLNEYLAGANSQAHQEGPEVVVLPLPTSAQFLNVIESVYSGMARAVIHNSDYATEEDARAAVDRYFQDRNRAFRQNPRRAGAKIWGSEQVLAVFDEANNCKDPRWMGWQS